MSIVSDLKEYAGLIKALGNQDLYRKIVDLQGEAVNLVSENMALREQVQDLQKTLNFAKTLTYKAPFYYAEADAAPYCSHCWEKSKQAIHVLWTPTSRLHTDECPECKAGFCRPGIDLKVPRR